MPQTRVVERMDASVTEVHRSEGQGLLAREYTTILAERDGDRRRLGERYGAAPSMR